MAKHTEFDQSSVSKVYVKFYNEQVSLKAMISSHLGRENFQVPFEKCQN